MHDFGHYDSLVSLCGPYFDAVKDSPAAVYALVLAIEEMRAALEGLV